ncbi:MAG: hypothetical protein WD314_11395 [Trueperaceae bacterium]
MPENEAAENTLVSFVRSSERRVAGERLQVWKSEATGREFEVRESNSYALGADLTPGSPGYVTYAGSAPTVTERPLPRSERLRRYNRQRMLAQQSQGEARRKGSSFPVGWLLVMVLLLAISWALFSPAGR